MARRQQHVIVLTFNKVFINTADIKRDDFSLYPGMRRSLVIRTMQASMVYLINDSERMSRSSFYRFERYFEVRDLIVALSFPKFLP